MGDAGDKSDIDSTFPLVTVEWLAQRLANPGSPDVRILDATWHLPGLGRDARAEYDAGHIPGARFFDLDGVSDSTSPLPHTMPDAAAFTASMRALGLNNDDLIVIYDCGLVHAAARARWMIRTFGHRACVILDGGLEAWQAAGQALEDDPVAVEAGNFEAIGPDDIIASLHDVRTALAQNTVTLLDARSGPRFQGDEAEPRAGLRAGHIPGSINLFFGDLYEGDGRMKAPETLQALFEDAGVDPARPVITTCGSGVTACCLALGLEILGKWDVMIYDGSWTEWGGDHDLPIETGAIDVGPA